jgi:hypothetical protein
MIDNSFIISDRNECDLDRPCLNGGSCTNTPGSYVCKCLQGFHGINCEFGKYIYIYIYHLIIKILSLHIQMLLLISS